MVPYDKVRPGLSDLSKSPIQITTWEAGAPAWSAYAPRPCGNSSMLRTPGVEPGRLWVPSAYQSAGWRKLQQASASLARASILHGRPGSAAARFWAQKALRRASGVWSLGGAGL